MLDNTFINCLFFVILSIYILALSVEKCMSVASRIKRISLATKRSHMTLQRKSRVKSD